MSVMTVLSYENIRSKNFINLFYPKHSKMIN